MKKPKIMPVFRLAVFLLCGISAAFGEGVNPLSIHQIAPDQFQLDWFASYLRPYQLEASPDLLGWVDMGSTVVGTGATNGILVQKTNDKMFFRLREGAIRPGFDGTAMSREDDHTYPQFAVPGVAGNATSVPIGFQINFFGNLYSECYVNNNGNISFESEYGVYTPESLKNLQSKVIAPFWADVDTTNLASNVTKFSSGNETVDGHPSFGVTYKNVGYYSNKGDKLNSFQVILIQRYDTGANNFDIEFNYNRVTWETGGYSGGSNGYGGKSARAGVTNGGAFSAEIAGSGIPSSFLDTILATGAPNLGQGLIYKSYNSNIPGRFIFHNRDGSIEGTFTLNAGPDQALTENHSADIQLNGSINPSNYSGLGFKWIQKDTNPPVVFSNTTILNPVVTIPTPGIYQFELTASGNGVAALSASDTVEITHPATFDVYAGDNLNLTAPESLIQTLHGTATFSGGAAVSVHWTQIYGDNATISNPNSLDPIVTLPGPGFYDFTMTATTSHASPFIQSSVTSIFYYTE
ncbi:MAG: nidogen-like domain-containing protein [Luteolibacter sp.]